MEATWGTPALNTRTIEAAEKVLRVVGRIMAEWDLSPAQEQKLLGVSKSTWQDWKGGHVRAPLDAACAERVSYILRIYAALGTLIPIPERAVAWVSVSNAAPLFGGKPALARMLGGQVGDLMVVADYLDAQREGTFS